MKELNTGTKPSKTYTSEEVATIINGAMRLDRQNKALRDELEEARERLGKVDKYKKSLQDIGLITYNNYDHDTIRIYEICKEALK